MRRDNKPVSDPFRYAANGTTMSSDDLSMLNMVLQRVKGINSVSGSVREVMAPNYDSPEA